MQGACQSLKSRELSYYFFKALIYIDNYLKSPMNLFSEGLLDATKTAGFYRAFCGPAIFADLSTKTAGRYFQRLTLKLF